MGSTTLRWSRGSSSWRWRATHVEREGRAKRKKPAPRRRLLRFATANDYLRRAAFFAPFFAAFLRAPPLFAPALAPFFADLRADDFLALLRAPFLAAAMVISNEGVERSIEPPVVRTSQWLDAEASSPPRHLLMASR